MARSLQSASLSFGLVNIPVKLYTATTSKSISFHLLHQKDRSRIREQLMCIAEDKPVSRGDLLKGYEVSRGKYVTLTDQELKALEADANRNVEIQEFVPLKAVDPVYFKKAYYLGPDKDGEKPYGLLAQSMAHEGRAAIAQFVQRGKEELVMVRSVDSNKLMLHVLYYADEVRAFGVAPMGKPVSQRELVLATQLIHHLEHRTWDPTHYRDTYRERVLALIKQKQQGKTIVVPKAAPTPGKVLDLMAALKQSLPAGKAPQGKDRPAAPAPVKTPRKKTAAKRRRAA